MCSNHAGRANDFKWLGQLAELARKGVTGKLTKNSPIELARGWRQFSRRCGLPDDLNESRTSGWCRRDQIERGARGRRYGRSLTCSAYPHECLVLHRKNGFYFSGGGIELPVLRAGAQVAQVFLCAGAFRLPLPGWLQLPPVSEIPLRDRAADPAPRPSRSQGDQGDARSTSPRELARLIKEKCGIRYRAAGHAGA